MQRRHILLGAATAALGACGRDAQSPATLQGGFTDRAADRGHRLRQLPGVPMVPARQRRAQILILGAGVAGLAAARALRAAGVEDFAVLDLEDQAGGNARAGQGAQGRFPLGAHYLPVPGADAPEVQDFLEELGLRTRQAGRWQWDERHLCHSPQERLFLHGAWQEGLLPLQGVGAATLEQYQRFAALVARAQRAAHWTLPKQKRPPALVQQQLGAITFETFLQREGLHDAYLRWYLDYCCRDDYGAGVASVSAWAGLHYFASRHGFHAPGSAEAEREGVFTWPEGNAWLTERLAAPLQQRLHTARLVQRVTSLRHAVQVDVWEAHSATLERWTAHHAIVALPIFVAARVVQNAPDFLRQAAQRLAYAPWLVANWHLERALQDRPGAPPSWDNVVFAPEAAPDGAGLGYVDAQHQSLRPVPAATVLTHYRALGDVAAPGLAPGVAGRHVLLGQTWDQWRDTLLRELARAHPDLAHKATRLDLTRYGHAMAMPLPNADGKIGHWPSSALDCSLSKSKQSPAYPDRPFLAWERLAFAHSDWAGYSVFEEAFTLGNTTASALAQRGLSAACRAA